VIAGLTGTLTEAAYATGWTAVRRMPAPVARRVFTTAADQAWRRHGKGVRQLERNLARVRPDASPEQLRALSRAGMRSYLRYWSEAFRLPDLSPEQVVSSFLMDDEHHLADALATGRGVVVSLPHMGNWDHAGAWATLTHARVVSVAERLQPEGLYEKFLDYRRALGMEILPLTGAEPPFRTLMARLRDGGLVALLGDRDLTRAGVPVQMFGETTQLPAGPAALAVATGAVLLTATLWYDPTHSRGRMHPPIEVPEHGTKQQKILAMTQATADSFAEGIRQYPQDWHMLQRLWLSDLDPAKAPVQA
jgi:KDO2-lipid IV(A) lauroyltransferase